MRTTIRVYELVVQQRVEEGLKYIQAGPRPSPAKKNDAADSMALLLLFKNEKVKEANRLVLAYIG